MNMIEPGTGVFIELAGAGEDDDSYIGVAKDRQFFRLLQQSAPPLRESHLSARRIIDPPDYNLASPHA